MIRENVRLAQKFEAMVRSDPRFEIPAARSDTEIIIVSSCQLLCCSDIWVWLSSVLRVTAPWLSPSSRSWTPAENSTPYRAASRDDMSSGIHHCNSSYLWHHHTSLSGSLSPARGQRLRWESISLQWKSFMIFTKGPFCYQFSQMLF